MLGHSHALSGGVTGIGTGILLHMSIPQITALAGLTAGMALLPDLDKCGSSPARSLGFVSEGVAWTIGRISGGHRHATHSFLGIALFTGLAWISCHFRSDWGGKAGLALLMTLSVAAGLKALHIARSHVADLIGIGVASWEVWFGYGLRLIPLAVLLGCCTHIAGDMLTDSGCMLWFPAWRRRFHLLPEPFAFTTGTAPELLIVDPLLTGALLVLAGWATDPAFVVAQWHALAG
ncbi:MAG TPA: metal-dependent hydrolase [Streptosporangiaceae bacterium]